MKLYKTTSYVSEGCANGANYDYTEFNSSGADASKTRTRLKKLQHQEIKTVEVEVNTDRQSLIRFLNSLTAHESWISVPVAEKLGG